MDELANNVPRARVPSCAPDAPGAQPVLVVEDDEDLRCLLHRELVEAGHRVRAVASAEDALAAIARELPAVVVTDIRLPALDGVGLTRWIKQCSPEVQVILLTGFASLDTATEALRLGAFDYLTKPLGDIGRLRTVVGAALARHAAASAATDEDDDDVAEGDPTAGLLDQLPLGALLLDRKGRVCLQSRTARELLALHDGLSLGPDRRLYAARPGETARLRELHAAALAAPDAGRGRRTCRRLAPQRHSAGGAMSISRPSCGRPYSVLVTRLPVPFALPTGRGGRRTTAEAAVFVGDPERRISCAEDMLCQLHGLTRAEARLAAELLRGRSLEEAAALLAISPNTARTHLKRIFAKTCTSRQGDLISLLLSGPALLQLEGG